MRMADGLLGIFKKVEVTKKVPKQVIVLCLGPLFIDIFFKRFKSCFR
jgi:hypothetical protein